MRRGGGIGFIVVLIAAAIVLILAMRAWLAVAPTAEQILRPSPAPGAAAVPSTEEAPGQSGAKGQGRGGSPERGAAGPRQARPGLLPDLSEMKQETDQHAKEVERALEETER